jgi:hypothetical protein
MQPQLQTKIISKLVVPDGLVEQPPFPGNLEICSSNPAVATYLLRILHSGDSSTWSGHAALQAKLWIDKTNFLVDIGTEI